MVTKYQLGAILLVILAASAYVIFQDNVKIVVGETNTKLYLNEDGWVLRGTEYNKLFNGSKSVIANAGADIQTDYNLVYNTTTIKRTRSYKNGAVITDTYFFDGNDQSVENFPISHKIEIFNGTGLIYEWYVRNLPYSGATFYPEGQEIELEKNIKVEWNEGNYYGRMQDTITYDGVLRVRWKVTSDYEVYYNRLFDPVSSDWNAEQNVTFENRAGMTFAEYVFNTTVSTTNFATNCIDPSFVNTSKDEYLAYELEDNTCNSSAINSSYYWINVKNAQVGNQTNFMQYNHTAPADNSNYCNVWNGSYVYVFHMGGLDATQKNSACKPGAPNSTVLVNAQSVATGIFGRAIQVNSNSTANPGDSGLKISAGNTFINDQNFTMEFWFKENKTTGSTGFFGWSAAACDFSIFTGQGEFKNSLRVFSAGVSTDFDTFGSYPANYSQNQTIYFVLKADRARAYLYVGNGTKIDNVANLTRSGNKALCVTSDDIFIGSGPSGGVPSFNGTIDEVRISNYNMSDAQIKANYKDSIVRFNAIVTASHITNVTILKPTAGQTLANNSIQLNTQYNDTYTSTWYILNNGTNTTFTPNTTFIGQEGSNSIEVCVLAPTNNINCSTTLFFVYRLETNITVWLNSDGNQTYEFGTIVAINASSNGSSIINLAIDCGGDNLTSRKNAFQYNWTSFACKTKWNSTNYTDTLNSLTSSPKSFFSLNRLDQFESGNFTIVGGDASGYPENITIDIGDDGSVDYIIPGPLSGATTTINKFNDSTSVKNLTITFNGGRQIFYVNLVKGANVTNATLTVNPQLGDTLYNNFNFSVRKSNGQFDKNGTIFAIENTTTGSVYKNNVYLYSVSSNLLSGSCENISSIFDDWRFGIRDNGTRYIIGNYETFIAAKTYFYNCTLDPTGNSITIASVSGGQSAIGIALNGTETDKVFYIFTEVAVHAQNGVRSKTTGGTIVEYFNETLIANGKAESLEFNGTHFRTLGLSAATSKPIVVVRKVDGTLEWWHDVNGSDLYGIDYDGNFTWIKNNFTGPGASQILRYKDLQYPVNLSIDIGNDGSKDYVISGETSSQITLQLNTSIINTYLANCTAINGSCRIPLGIATANSPTKLEASLSFSYTLGKLQINKTTIDNILASSGRNTTLVNVTVTASNGYVQLTNLTLRYNGTAYVNITAWFTGNLTYAPIYSSKFARVVYSGWNYTLPSPSLTYIEFIPTTNESKNVTPFGQTSTKPILNFTMERNYDDSANFSFILNNTLGCIDYLVGNSSDPTKATFINTSWVENPAYRNLPITYSRPFYMFANYNCPSSSGWSVATPDLYIRVCSNMSICSFNIT